MSTSPPPAPASKFPTFSQVFHWIFNWRTVRRVVVAVAALFTLLALVWTEENWRGRHAWATYRRELEAKGEKWDLASFVPPRVADGQNFAMTPFLAPLFDFNPEPLKPGQRRWRDTNGFDRTMDFARGLSLPDPAKGWIQMQPTDLPACARDLDGKKTPHSQEKPVLTQSQAASEVLRKLDHLNPVLDEVRQASQRSFVRFNINYDQDDTWGILLPHLTVLKRLGMLFQLRASAELALGQSGPALADTKMVFYLADAMKDEPFLISKLVRIAILKISLQPVWEGLAGHQWSESQLVELEQRLEKIDLLTEYGRAIRAERAFVDKGIDVMRGQRRAVEMLSSLDVKLGVGQITLANLVPGGWFYQNELLLDRMYQEQALPVFDAAGQRAFSSKMPDDEVVEKELTTGFPPYHILAKMVFPALRNCAVKFAAGQTGLNEAVIGCALERYRLIHGQFPETLDALSPLFINKIPHDILTGEPLKYHRTEDGRFILYSVGWNEKDDGGVTRMRKGATAGAELTHGDWVWQYPAK